jgi:hypothetical protein
LAGQFVQASQVVVEDYAMSDAGMAPLKVVGFEGLFGTLAFFALLPLAQVMPWLQPFYFVPLVSLHCLLWHR